MNRPTSEEIQHQSMLTQAAWLEKIRRLSLELVLPADPAFEMERLLNGPEIQNVAALLIAWLRADPVAALGFMEGSDVLFRNSNMTRSLNLWIAEAGIDEVDELMDAAPTWLAKLVSAMVQVATSEDFAKMNDLLERMEGESGQWEVIGQSGGEAMDKHFESKPNPDSVARWALELPPRPELAATFRRAVSASICRRTGRGCHLGVRPARRMVSRPGAGTAGDSRRPRTAGRRPAGPGDS